MLSAPVIHLVTVAPLSGTFVLAAGSEPLTPCINIVEASVLGAFFVGHAAAAGTNSRSHRGTASNTTHSIFVRDVLPVLLKFFVGAAFVEFHPVIIRPVA